MRTLLILISLAGICCGQTAMDATSQQLLSQTAQEAKEKFDDFNQVITIEPEWTMWYPPTEADAFSESPANYVKLIGDDWENVQQVCGEGTWADGSPIYIGWGDTGVDRTHARDGDLLDTIGQDFTGSSNGIWDVNGHGTWVGGAMCAQKNGELIFGLCPKAQPLSMKVLSDRGSGTSQGIAAGIRRLVQYGEERDTFVFINLSLGSSSPSGSINNACKIADESEHAIVFASIGNSGQGGERGGWPGRSEYTVGMGAVDYNFRAASFTSESSDVDITDFGVNALSLGLQGGRAGMSGTSMSSPVACGRIALWYGYLDRMGRPLPTNRAALLQSIRPYLRDLGQAGKDRIYGEGWFDLAAAVRDNPIGEPTPDPDPDPDPDPLPPELEHLRREVEVLKSKLDGVRKALEDSPEVEDMSSACPEGFPEQNRFIALESRAGANGS